MLAIDPGALRLGWALLNTEPLTLIASGIQEVPKGDDEKHGDYLDRLICHWTEEAHVWLLEERPDLIVTERLPVILSNVQATSARIALTVIRSVAYRDGYPMVEIAANTIKKDLTGNGKATKVAVRNAVIATFPELEPRKRELTNPADESDAIGIGIVGAKRFGK